MLADANIDETMFLTYFSRFLRLITWKRLQDSVSVNQSDKFITMIIQLNYKIKKFVFNEDIYQSQFIVYRK